MRRHHLDNEAACVTPACTLGGREKGRGVVRCLALLAGSFAVFISCTLAANITSAADIASAEADPSFVGTPYPAEQEAIVHEEEAPASYGLTGGWGGVRQAFESRGISLQGLYTGEVVDTFAGGALHKSGTIYHDNLDLTLSIDTGKAGLWKGGTLWLYGLQNHGGDPSAAKIGDLQVVSNIAVPHDQCRLFEAWYNQDFADGTVSLLAGLHNLNSEFYVSDYGSLFLNSSFGIGPELSANVPVSIFPKAGLGVRLRLRPAEGYYLQAAAYDGDPATLALHAAEGYFDIAETGYSRDGSDYKLGCWRHSADKTRSGSTTTYDSDYGVYGVVDQELFKLNTSPTSSLGLFVQLGWVPSDRNDVTGYLGTGLHMHGPFPGRAEDDVGVAMARADTHQDAETVLELTYRFVASSWLSLRPDFQWIFNPGGDKSVPTAKVGMLRFEVTL